MNLKLIESYQEYQNDKVKVVVNPIKSNSSYFGQITHLAISRHDGKKIIGWKKLMKIKQQLFPNKTAIEVYPPKGKIIDNANVYHLWVLNEELPFGLHNLETLAI